MDEFTKMYAPPSFFLDNWTARNNDEDITSYISKEVDKSKSFLRSNRGWKSADICMAIFYGDETEKIPVGLSKVSVKKLRRAAREAVANASNIRPIWKHKSRKDKFPKQAETMDKLRDDWFYTQFVIQKIKAALQYAAGGGTGYLWLWPDIDLATGQIEIIPNVLSWRQFLPHHAGTNATPDNLYGFTIHLEMPVPEAHRKFPNHISIIRADRDTPSAFSKGWRNVQRVWKGVADRMNNRQAAIAQDPYPVADIFYTWINDDSINTSGRDIFMGQAGAHYSYIVPSLYDEEGNLNPKLTREDCKLFPYKRLIISTKHGVIWDGPPMWINRFAPIVPFYFEKVVGEFLGINIIRDGRRLEESTNNMLRAIEDAVVGRLSPPIAIDTSVPKDIRAKLARNSRSLIGKVFQYSGIALAKAITPLMDHNYYNIDTRAMDIVKYGDETKDYLMGTKDLAALARKNQMPAADTLEAYLAGLGSIATDQSIGIEQSMVQMARIWADFCPQVYTTERIIILLGADHVIGTADFDPNSLVPKEDDYPNCDYPERLQKHMRNFSIYAAPNSLMERMSQTHKLVLMTLTKMGVEISKERLYETFLDDGQYSLEKKKWFAEQIETIKITAILQKALAEANAAADPQNALATKLLEELKGQSGNEGRPPTNRNPPRLEGKTDEDGAMRSTVATS